MEPMTTSPEITPFPFEDDSLDRWAYQSELEPEESIHD